MTYFILSFFATTIGTIVGVGGGLIIRPLLNLLDVSKGLASFTSAITVFAMALTNFIVCKIQGKKIEVKNIVLVGVGATIGGFFGGSLMVYFSERFINITYLGAVLVMLVSVIIREKVEIESVQNPIIKILLGTMCGMLSSFFGIGGGPFLMTVLLVFLNLDPKEAAIQSVLITMLSTTSSMIRYAISGYADFSLAAYCVSAGILGGIIGRKISVRLKDSTVRRLFYLVLAIIIMVQLYTVFMK